MKKDAGRFWDLCNNAVLEPGGTGHPGHHSPIVQADGKFKSYSKKTFEERWEWEINEDFDVSSEPVFAFSGLAVETWHNQAGWELDDWVVVRKPDLTPVVDEGISCNCNCIDCPPGTPQYSNSSILISFPLGNSFNGDSAGYMMIHETKPSGILNDSSALKIFPGAGTTIQETNENGIARTVITDQVRVHIIDDPDSDPLTFDWSIQLFKQPYTAGDMPYHEIVFQASYGVDSTFESFTVSETGDLGNHKRSYVWKSETVPAMAASAVATIEDGSVSGFILNDYGDAYGSSPEVAVFGDGSGALGTAHIEQGVLHGIEVLDGGSGYTSPPAVAFIRDYGSGAIIEVGTADGVIVEVGVANGGFNYNFNDTITITDPGGGSGAVLVPNFDFSFSTFSWYLHSVAVVESGSDYTEQTVIGISTVGGSGAVILPPVIWNGVIQSVNVTEGGIGYFGEVEISITDPAGLGHGAVIRPIIDNGRLVSGEVLNGGADYSALALAEVVPAPSTIGYGAEAVAIIEDGSVVGIELISGGANYPRDTQVVISGGGGSGAVATVQTAFNVLSSISVADGGSGYTVPPTVTIAPPEPEVRSGWELVYFDTDLATPLKREFKRRSTRVDGSEVEVVSIKNGDGTLLWETLESYGTTAYGRRLRAIVESVIDANGVKTDEIVTDILYYSNPNDQSYGLERQRRTSHNGYWQRAEYDSDGMPSRIVSQHESSRIDDNDDLSRVVEYHYPRVDLGTDSEDEVITVRTERLLGEVVSREFEIWWSHVRSDDLIGSGGTFQFKEKWIVRALDPSLTTVAAAIASNDLLITKYRYYHGGEHDGKLRSTERPDGKITILEYSSDGLDTTRYEGTRASASEDVIKGTRRFTSRTASGSVLEETIWSYPENLLLRRETATSLDDFDRVLSVAYQRPTGGPGSSTVETYATSARVYSCCGLQSETDKAGITTTYQRDGLKRVYQTTRGTMVSTQELDALGRTIVSTVNGVVQMEAAYDSTGLMVSERRLFKDALVETTRTFDRSHAAYDVETVEHFDGSQSIRYFHKDGSLYQRLGNRELPVRMATDTANGELHQTALRLNPVGGSYIESGEYTRTVYDMAGRVKRIETPHPNGAGVATTRYDYLSNGQLNWIEDPDQVKTYRTYDAFNDPSGSYVNHPATGLVSAVSSGYTYSAEYGVPVKEETFRAGSDPSDLRRVLTSSDGLQTWTLQYGRETHTEIDYQGPGYSRRVKTTLPDLTYHISKYDSEGFLERREQFAADGSSMGWVAYQYDAQGRLVQQTDARSGTTTFVYYADGRIQSMTTPDPDGAASGVGNDPQTTHFNYSLVAGGGVRTDTTLPDASVRVSIVDPLGRSVLEYGSQTTPVARTYDYAGRLAAQTTWRSFDPATGTGISGAATTGWIYNPAGLLQEKRYAVVSAEEYTAGPAYTYTAAGRLQTETLARGITNRRVYNAEGLLWRIDEGDNGTFETTTTYDNAGRPVTIADASGTRHLTYAYGSLDSETYATGPLSGYTIDRTFDDIGRYRGFSLEDGHSILHAADYAYHPNTGRLHAVTTGEHTATYTYLPNTSLVDDIVFNNGTSDVMTHHRDWDHLNRLQRIETTDAQSAVLTRSDYRYNDLNQRVRNTDQDGNYWAYSYDSLGQLETAVQKNALDVERPLRNYGYAFDDIGNRTSRDVNSGISTYSANDLNQYDTVSRSRKFDIYGEAPLDLVMSANTETLQRDGTLFYGQLDFSSTVPASEALLAAITIEGTLVGAGHNGTDAVREVGREAYFPPAPFHPVHDDDGNLEEDGRWLYTWDARNQLVSMETHPIAHQAGLNKVKLAFEYDSQGRRFSKTVENWDAATSSFIPQNTTFFLYDGWNLIAEIELLPSSLSLLTSYLWGLDMSGSFQGAGGVGGLLAVTTRSGLTAYPAFDGNGNVMGYYDATSAESVAEFEYGPFGELLRETGSHADELKLRFSTKYQDAETGLLYYGFRFLIPETGRWLNRDPIGEAGGLNLYGFVGNDGVNRWDYLGLVSVTHTPPGGIGVVA